MTKHLICPDVSEFQAPLDHTYTRDFVIFRVMFGANYLDPKFLRNANAAKRLHDDGRIAGALLYVVYTADPLRAQYKAAWDAIGPTIPRWLTGIMIDVETWRGKSYEISGDHSRRLNRLYGMHAHRFGNWNSVIAYGNAGDLAELYPGRDRRCRVIVASYGSDLSCRRVRGAIGQQYSDGQARYPVPRLGGRRLPRSSAPFGACDHNVFPGIATGRELVQILRPEQLRHGDHPDHVRATPRRPRKPVTRVAEPVRKPVVPPKKKPVDKPVATKPVPPAAPARVVRPDALVSRNGAHSLVLHDDGTLEVRHRVSTSAITAPPTPSITTPSITTGEH